MWFVRSRIGRPSSNASLKSVVAVWQTPPPIDGQDERADDHLAFEEPSLRRARPDDVVEREHGAGLDDRAVDEVGHQMDVVDPVRRRLAHLRRVGDELLADPERLCLRRRPVGPARPELDPSDVTVAGCLHDRLDELRRVDVATRTRLRHANTVARNDELRVMGTHDPLPEAWADEPRELLSVEGDREPPAVTVHTQCTCELRPRKRPAARAVVVDRDGGGE